ncbi:hypothetical protein [Saccharopolyspora sp. NPDC002376]
MVDVIHVLEHLWKAAWCFYDEADPAAETWVHTQAQAVFEGHATRVAGTIRATATRRRGPPPSSALRLIHHHPRSRRQPYPRNLLPQPILGVRGDERLVE